MKILILDDQDARHEHFSKLYQSHERTHVRTVKEATDALLADTFDAALLDHDLGDKEDGRDMARWLAANPDRAPKTIVIHSSNFYGANEMVAILNDVGIKAIHKPQIAR